MSLDRLIIFVKAPRPGTVKTRLGLAPEAACGAYRRLVQTVLSQVATLSDVELRFTPDDGRAEIASWLKPGWQALPQCAGDLGTRLQHAFQGAFANGAKHVVIIGSDCPYLTGEDIQTAWAALKVKDVVLGPAEDGGYWLIGLRTPQPDLFRNMPWSSKQVLSETLARAKGLGLKTQLLRTLSDVDSLEAWKRFTSAATPGPRLRQSPA